MCDLGRFLIHESDKLRTVIALIDKNAQGIALVVDPDRRLLATITDGDVRRAMLAGLELDDRVAALLQQRTRTGRPPPVTAPVGTPTGWLLSVMKTNSLRHIPLLDSHGRVVDLALLSEFVEELDIPVTAVVMAGGLGKRLRPLTDTLPKPMLPIGDRPLLERIVGQLKASGVRRIMVTTHYKPEEITGHFGDGKDFGVDISYQQETQPLGTAGGLRQVEPGDGPLLVLNGDILTGVDFRSMVTFHTEQAADMTVALRRVESQVPYGVVEVDQARVVGITEKPSFSYLANAGIYLLNREVCGYIPEGQQYQMTDLIGRLLEEGKRVAGFLLREYWLDIGQPEDYQRAQREHIERKVS